MRKKIYATLMALPLFVSTLVGCSSLHVHTIDSPWESNETSHWKTCKTCHEKFEEHEHTFNDFNDKCFICDYVDPLVHINEGGEITSLTEHGKTKLTFNVPNKVGDIVVRSIGPDAFNGSKALTVKLNKELDYYYRDSFTNSAVRFINTEEELVNWVQPDNQGRIYKKRVFDDNVAMIDNNFYPTLAEAFDAVKGDDTTITLLRDELKINDPIEVKHAVSLVSYYSKTNLTCNFNINTVGILYIPETINYQGDVKLILGETKETCAESHEPDKGNKTQDVYTSGSLVFVNKEKCPKGVKVSYTHTFETGEEGVPAHGATQIVNDAIIALPRKHFAFGTFTFNDNFQGIRGLTKYGLTVNGLNITKVAEHIDAYIGGHAFSVASSVELEVTTSVVGDVEITARIEYHFLTSKGLFFDLTIGEGIKRVLGNAFDCHNDFDMTSEGYYDIAPLLSHLSSVTIGPDVEEIGSNAFYANYYLSSIGGSAESLETIGEGAFSNCFYLQSVELSHAKNLKTIKPEAFYKCSSLIYVHLPAGAWKYKGVGDNFGYFPYDLTPEKIAYKFSSGVASDKEWFNNEWSNYTYSYTFTLREDSSGTYNDVWYTHDLSMAMMACDPGGEIYISKNEDGKEKVIYLDDLYAKDNITITAAPGVENIYVAQNKNNPNITVESSESEERHLILSNVLPKGTVTLKADTNPETGATKHTAGFAIRGVNDNDIPEVNLITNDAEPITINNLVGSESIIRGLTYEHTYGMFNFRVDGDTTYIHDTSPFGDKVQGMTVARQTEEARNVVLADRAQATIWGNNIVNLTLSSDVKEVGDRFFKNFDTLERLVWEDGDGPKTIGRQAFEGCDALVSASLPNSVTSIDQAAFNSCNELTTINIPTSLEVIPYQCFRDCPMLESIDIPDNIKSIGEQAFYVSNDISSDPLLKYVTFGKNLESIGKNAFSGNTEIIMLNLPKSLTTIGEGAFNGCTGLSGVYLLEDNELGTIGVNAFKDCVSLVCFYFAGNINGWIAGGQELDSEELSDESIAAEYLRVTYVDSEWSRQLP